MSKDENHRFSMILWQLQQYQHVIREWDSSLDPYEFKVVMQVLDRTVGWQKLQATFRPSVMLKGDRKYSGFGDTMHRSKLMKVLAKLERRGVIRREPDPVRPGLKVYAVNLDWKPDHNLDVGLAADEVDLLQSNGVFEDVSTGDEWSAQWHCPVSVEAADVSDGDPRESYRDNTILTGIHENTIGADPSPTAPEQRVTKTGVIRTPIRPVAGSADALPATEINPPLRLRTASR